MLVALERCILHVCNRSVSSWCSLGWLVFHHVVFLLNGHFPSITTSNVWCPPHRTSVSSTCLRWTPAISPGRVVWPIRPSGSRSWPCGSLWRTGSLVKCTAWVSIWASTSKWVTHQDCPMSSSLVSGKHTVSGHIVCRHIDD